MRELRKHKVAGSGLDLTIKVLGNTGPGGANHLYEIRYDDKETRINQYRTEIEFQNGPIKEVGINGVSHEALLAIIIDRLEKFQEGPFKSAYNGIALEKCEEALFWLQQRTRDRIA